MSNDQKHRYRDGISQSSRYVKALDPSLVSMIDSSMLDSLNYAQKISEKLSFAGLLEDIDLRQLISYFKDPSANQDAQGMYSEPHLVLFLTFLELLKYPQKQFDDLSKRYLDHYYGRILGVKPQNSVSDKVFVLFELEKEVKECHLKKGSLLDAGNGAMYALDEDIVLSDTQISSVKMISSEDDDHGIIYNCKDLCVEDNHECTSFVPGFIISSPVLYLPEGLRQITLKITYQQKDYFTLDQFGEEFLNSTNIYLTTQDGWTKFNFVKRDTTIWTLDDQKIYISFVLNPEDPGIVLDEGCKAEWEWPSIRIDCLEKSWAEHIYIKSIEVSVDVKGVKNIKIRSGESILDVKTPFELFGNSPAEGSAFYFANEEICVKTLDYLKLNPVWVPGPSGNIDIDLLCVTKNADGTDMKKTVTVPDIDSQYENYAQTDICSSWPSVGSFKVGLGFYCQHVETEISNRNGDLLFGHLEYNALKKKYVAHLELANDGSPQDPFQWEAYYKLEFVQGSFLYDQYFLVLKEIAQMQARENIADMKQGKVSEFVETIKEKIFRHPKKVDLKGAIYPPYVPKLRALTLDYKSTAVLSLNHVDQSDAGMPCDFFQMHPFGLKKLLNKNYEKKETAFLARYPAKEYLFIGFENVDLGRNLSVLIQINESSALTEQEVYWEYLAEDGWESFDGELMDETNHMQQTGRIMFKVPLRMTDQNLLMPKGIYWIRVVGGSKNRFVSKILDIRIGASLATYVQDGIDPERTVMTLPEGSIKGLVEGDSNIKSVTQPCDSFQGKPKESASDVYKRVSERIRHRNRALTASDYEHMILEQFPDVLKVKCIAASEMSDPIPGQVDIVIIPKKKVGFLETGVPDLPKANNIMLQEIKAFISKYTSNVVKVFMKNPRYEEVKCRIVVKIKKEYDSVFYIKKLNEDLSRFMSPWAFGDESSISFTNIFYNAKIVEYINQQPYIENLSLFEFILQQSIDEPEDKVSILDSDHVYGRYPDSIIVSARNHAIQNIEDPAKDLSGIGFMLVANDFRVKK